MLVYLLLRAEDRPILEHSQGLLRWIVLDEAHGFMGPKRPKWRCCGGGSD